MEVLSPVELGSNENTVGTSGGTPVGTPGVSATRTRKRTRTKDFTSTRSINCLNQEENKAVVLDANKKPNRRAKKSLFP